MPEVIRVRCPVCGMMTDLEEMKKTADSKPPEIRVFIQKYGGKKKVEPAQEYKKFRRGQNPGSIEYTDVTAQMAGKLGELVGWFSERAKKFLESV